MLKSWFVKGRGLYNGIKVNSSAYFISNNCVSCGWGEPALKCKEIINDFETYKLKWIQTFSPKWKWGYQGIHYLFESVEKGDYLWTRLNGVYYVALINTNPIELFNIDLSLEAQEHDCVVQLRNIKWIKCGTEESVPGSVSTFSRNRKSVIRIDNNESTLNNMTATSIFSDRVINPNKRNLILDRSMILNFLGPSVFEDLIAIWLFDKFGYFVIPSTSKKSTQMYEFVLINGMKNKDFQKRRMIYLQAKNGNVDLKANNYKHLISSESEIWLVTSGGVIYNFDETVEPYQIVKFYLNDGVYKSQNFGVFELVDFVFDKSKHYLIPESILKFQEMFN